MKLMQKCKLSHFESFCKGTTKISLHMNEEMNCTNNDLFWNMQELKSKE